MCMCKSAYDITTKSEAVFPSFKASMEHPGKKKILFKEITQRFALLVTAFEGCKYLLTSCVA